MTEQEEHNIDEGMEGPEQSCGEYQAAVSFKPSDNNPLSRLVTANGAGTRSQHEYKSLLLRATLT